MSSTPEHGITHRALAPELESKTIPLDNTRQIAVREGRPVSCKTTRPLDEDDLLDEDEDRSQISQLISSKRRRLEDGTAQIVRHERERKSVLSRYGVLYRLNRAGSGVFTVNKQRPKIPGEISEVRAQPAMI